MSECVVIAAESTRTRDAGDSGGETPATGAGRKIRL
jgi:hypothetical protein